MLMKGPPKKRRRGQEEKLVTPTRGARRTSNAVLPTTPITQRFPGIHTYPLQGLPMDRAEPPRSCSPGPGRVLYFCVHCPIRAGEVSYRPMPMETRSPKVIFQTLLLSKNSQNFPRTAAVGKKEAKCLIFSFLPQRLQAAQFVFLWLRIVDMLIETSSCDDRRSILA